MTTATKKTGRPSTYTKDKAAEVCARLVEGESLRSICRDPAMPDIKTIYLWMGQNEEFLHQYAKAKEDQADTLQEDILDIADTLPEQVVDDKGIARVDAAYVNWMRLRVDSRKWIASKLKPKKYGDRTTLAGDKDNPVEVRASTEIFDAVLANIEMTAQAKK